MLQPIITAEELESANEDLRLEQEFTSLESYIDKFDGMTMMGHALNAMPKLSIETAALTEVASAILARGTDLSGADDFVPGLESMVVSGLEAANTGQGFLDKAKKVGAAIMEKIKKIIAWITDKLKGATYTKAKDLLAKIDKISEELKDADDSHKFEIPELFVKILKDPLPNKVKQFLEIDPFKGTGSIELYSNTEMWLEYMKGMENNFRLLTTASNPKFTDGYDLDVLPIINTINVGSSDDYKVRFNTTEKDENRTFKNTTMTVREFKDGMSSMQYAINYIESFIKIYTKAYDKFLSEISSKSNVDVALHGGYKYMGSHLAMLRVITYAIPTEMLDTYNTLLMLKTGTGQSS